MSPTRGTICFLSLQIGVVEIYLAPLTISPWSTAGSRWRLAAWGGASHVHRAPSNRHPSGHNIFSECPDWNCWNLFDRPRVPLGASCAICNGQGKDKHMRDIAARIVRQSRFFFWLNVQIGGVEFDLAARWSPLELCWIPLATCCAGRGGACRLLIAGRKMESSVSRHDKGANKD